MHVGEEFGVVDLGPSPVAAPTPQPPQPRSQYKSQYYSQFISRYTSAEGSRSSSVSSLTQDDNDINTSWLQVPSQYGSCPDSNDSDREKTVSPLSPVSPSAPTIVVGEQEVVEECPKKERRTRRQKREDDELAALQASYLERKVTRFAPTWITALLTLGITSVTVYYSDRVMVNTEALPEILQLSDGTTVLVVNVLSHLVSFLCFSLFTDVMESMRWAMACRPKGIPLASFIAMSRATPILGLIYLCKIRGTHQIWAIQRFLAYILTALISLVLITNVAFRMIYNPILDNLPGTDSAELAVMAGLTPFSPYGLGNISLQLVPLLGLTSTLSFITDTRFVSQVQPLNCTASAGGDCLSIFMPGSMEAVRVWNSSDQGATIFSGSYQGSYDAVVVKNAPGFQLEFDSIERVSPGFEWNRTEPSAGGDCSNYLGSIGDGVYLCIRQMGNSTYIGWTVCDDPHQWAGTCQSDLSWTQDIKYNTTVSMYSRRATVAYDKQNISILSILEMSEPQNILANAAYLQLYADVLMSPIDQTSNRTADPNAFGMNAAKYGFGYGLTYLLRLYINDFVAYIDGGRSLLRSFVAVPVQYSTFIRQYHDITQESTENLVTAVLAKSSSRAIIQKWTVMTFGIAAYVTTIWCVVGLVWISFVGPYFPNLSFFPEINITSKSSVRRGLDYGSDGIDPNLEMADDTLEDLAMLTRNRGLGNGLSWAVVHGMKNKRVYCGSLPGAKEDEEVIVLVTREGGRLKCLNKHKKYS